MSESAAPPVTLLDGAALFLDFDGTLVDLAETPDGIVVAPDLPSRLRNLSRRLDGRVAIISGRAIGNLEQHLDCAGIAVSGSHGLELRLSDGTLVPLAAKIDLGDLRERIRRFANGVEGLIIEEKPASIALHYRKAPGEAERAERFMAALAASAGLVLQRGKMVAEIRPPGADKGDAVRAFMAQPPYGGSRPVFIGDDVTDEDAFEAVAAMGGAGILVGPVRETAAMYRLDGVDAVARWLEATAQ